MCSKMSVNLYFEPESCRPSEGLRQSTYWVILYVKPRRSALTQLQKMTGHGNFKWLCLFSKNHSASSYDDRLSSATAASWWFLDGERAGKSEVTYLFLLLVARNEQGVDVAISSSMSGELGSATISQHWYESRPEHEYEWLVWPLSCHNIRFKQVLPWDTTPSGKHSSPFLPALIKYTILTARTGWVH